MIIWTDLVQISNLSKYWKFVNSFKASGGIKFILLLKIEVNIKIPIDINNGISHLKDLLPKNNKVEKNKPIQADLELVNTIQITIKRTNIKEIILLKEDSFLIKKAKEIGRIIFSHAPV